MIQVKQGYNQLAKRYWIERERLKSERYVRELIKQLPKGARVLDIGCGDGVPVAKELVRRGLLVMGIDISEKMITLARRNCPRGEFGVKDMLGLKTGEYQVEAVVCMYALFHIPREQHIGMLQRIASWVVPGGKLLISMGDRDFEGEHEAYGVKMWSSHFGPKKNREMIEKVGFEILRDELDTSGQERHQIILGRKR